MLNIADVSEFQRTIDWAAYGAANPAVIVRVHNSNRPDSYARPNIAGARAHCVWRGWYQYLTAGADPAKAAHDFQATLGPTLPGEVMILDLEEGTGDQRARARAWLAALQDPVEWIYSGAYFARAHLPGVRVQWLAAYGAGEPGDSHDLWQFTDALHFSGITGACDASVFNGTIAALQALTNTKEPDMPVTPAEMQQIADMTVHTLLTANLGRSGPNVAVALQHASALSNTDSAAIAAAVLAAIPPSSGASGFTVDQLAKAIADETAKRLLT